jgi:hypothetical protein
VEGMTTRALIIRYHKKNIVKEDDETIMVKIDDLKEFMGPLLAALLNPEIEVVRMDEE